jgi:hypothetical protein
MPDHHRDRNADIVSGVRLSILALALLMAAQAALAFDWQQSNGPQGGQIFTLAEAPNGDLYAGSWWGAGIFRSTDQGASWLEVGLRGEQIHEIVIANGGSVFAGTAAGEVHRSQDNGATWPVSGSGIVGTFGALAYDSALDILYAARSSILSRSTDGGDSWEAIDANFPAVSVNALTVITNGGPLYAGTDGDKVYRSLDGGITWNLFDSGLTTNSIDDFLVVPEGYVYAASYGGGIYRTEWSGSTWIQLAVGLSDGYCLAIARDGAGRLWTGTSSSGTFFSEDDGTHWSPADVGLEGQEVRCLLALGPDELLAGSYGGGVHRTTDAGQSWSPSNQGMIAADVSAIAAAGAGGTVYAVTHGAGVARSDDDGVTWAPINTGIQDYDLFDLVIHPDGDLFVGGWRSQIYRSQNGGGSWTRADVGLGVSRVGCLAVKSGGDLFAGGYFGGGVWRSTNKGDSWFAANTGMTIGATEDLLVRGNGDLLAATRGGGIYRSDNDGGMWTPLNNGLTSLNVDRLLETSSGALLAATDDGLFRSLDDGALWESLTSSLSENSFGAIAVNPLDHLFAGTFQGGNLYRSLDGGDSWHLISDGFPAAFIRSLGFDQDGRLLVGTGGLGLMRTVQSTPVFLAGPAAERLLDGAVKVQWQVRETLLPWRFDVYREDKNGRRLRLTREPVTGGPAFAYLDADALLEESAYWLRCATPGEETAWFGPALVGAAGTSAPGLRLDAVRPNPVNDSTIIEFSLPSGGVADLSVYDLRGHLVRRLVRDPGAAGSQETLWDARDEGGNRVAAGTYLLRLEAAGRIVTRKVLVLGGER